MARWKLSASILSADLAHLADQVGSVDPFADVIHIDVMDGRFVPPITFGPLLVGALRRATARTLHGHLQVEEPGALFDEPRRRRDGRGLVPRRGRGGSRRR